MHKQFSDYFYERFEELIKRDTVQSVSCPLKDERLWSLLVREQLRRTQLTGCAPQDAFTLSGPDDGLDALPIAAWGGTVHIPYEGACGADLFILPDWRVVFPEADERGGTLSDVLYPNGGWAPGGEICHYILGRRDLGELQCAARKDWGDGWILYESNRPYVTNHSLKAW